MNAFRKSKLLARVVVLLTVLSTFLWSSNITALADGLDDGEGSSDFIEENVENEVNMDNYEEFTSDTIYFDLEGEVDSQALLGDYIDYMVDNGFSDGIPAYASLNICGDKLSGYNKKAYNEIKAMYAAVAAGNQSSTVVKVDVDEVKYYELDSNGFDGLFEKTVDLRLVWNAVMADSPYERYWAGLRVGASFNYNRKGSEYAITAITFQFLPSYEYAVNGDASTLEVDVNKTKAVKETIKEVENILANAKDKDDEGKVRYYKQRICELNEYNTAALSLSADKYGNPWQLVYVFDNDPSTNVVCEGYSKAFAYLCEKTEFSDSSIKAYTVTGDLLQVVKGELKNLGGHMWNVLHWSDSVNYLVDITNCDGDEVNDYLIFAKPASGSPETYYMFDFYGSPQIGYAYDDDTKAVYTMSELTIGVEQAEKLTAINVQHGDLIESSKPAEFKVVRTGGSSKTVYRLDSVKNAAGEAFLTNTDFQENNVFTVTFPDEGKYTLVFSAKDGDVVVNKTIEVDVAKGITEEQRALVRAFVERFYTEILNREAEEDGVNSWTEALLSGKMTGADVAKGFALSKELEAQNIDNATFVNRMYAGFFDRAADQDGFDAWIDNLYAGATRYYVVAGFVNSNEFKNLCAKYGIKPGSLEKKGGPTRPLSYPKLKLDSSKVKDEDLERYVERLYTTILGRSADAAGKETWVKVLKDGKDANGKVYDPATVASAFFSMNEYKSKNKSNEEFVLDAYQAFFGRDPRTSGDDGLAFWVDQLDTGKMSRTMVIERGFGQSEEFKNLLRSYGFKVL